MEILRDKFWLWGHSEGSHDYLWNGEKYSRMTPTEGAYYLGIKKVFMVCFGGEPKPPFDREAKAMDSLDEVVWSIVGDAGCEVTPDSLGHFDEIMRLAEKYPNITGTIFDDFFRYGDRDKIFTPEILMNIREKLHKRKLKSWVVMYDYDLENPVPPHLKAFDGVCYGIWDKKNFDKIEETCRRTREFIGDKVFLPCIYFNKPLLDDKATVKDTAYQLNIYTKMIREGVTDGLLLCSNIRADSGFETVEYVKSWLKEHGDEPV